MAQETGERDEPRSASAVSKAFRLLEILAAAEEPLPLHELASRAGMPKPSALRMLAQLEACGTVKRDLTGKRYAVGETLAALASTTIATLARQGSARDILRGLVARTGETCNLGVLEGDKILYLERVECEEPLRLHLGAGSRVPLHATAVGKLFLALLPEEKRRLLLEGLAMPKLTAKTLTRKALEAQLPEIARAGVSLNLEEANIGVIGVAVPVLDRRGRMMAGLAIHAPISRFGEERARASVPALREAAAQIAASFKTGTR
ncbi:IclR family transcriptional regulator [Afifella pfennigii]|uniref:IclR family transcriptional regulator n=1 Tax=Afifella pfennigii TaxID=209897 RepID=UPI00047DD510|nr:IclR family transcriptional regulator [Afifella pfennigii]